MTSQEFFILHNNTGFACDLSMMQEGKILDQSQMVLGS
jgi:hypothetical protein